MLVGEFHVGFHCVSADSKHNGSRLLNRCILVAESAGLFRATRGVVARVEVNDHRRSEKVFGIDLRTVGDHRAEWRGWITRTKT